MSAIYKRGRADMAANLTPMIDVTFLLIVFFVLVSQIVDLENVDMDLPTPQDPATTTITEEERIVVNILPEGERAAGYRVGSRTFPPNAEGSEAMRLHLAAIFQANPGIAINVRADRDTQYEYIEPVLDAVSKAALGAGVEGYIPRVNLVVNKVEDGV